MTKKSETKVSTKPSRSQASRQRKADNAKAADTDLTQTVKTEDRAGSSDEATVVEENPDSNVSRRREGKGLPVKGIEGGYMGNYSNGDYSQGRQTAGGRQGEQRGSDEE